MAGFAEQLKAFEVKATGRADEVVRGVVQEVGQRLIERSPIDTGRFKSNWYYGLESPDTRTSTATTDRVLHNTEELPAKASGFIHYVSNSLPYGPALERGHSKQAPQGMVGLTVIEWPQIVDAVALRVAA